MIGALISGKLPRCGGFVLILYLRSRLSLAWCLSLLLTSVGSENQNLFFSYMGSSVALAAENSSVKDASSDLQIRTTQEDQLALRAFEASVAKYESIHANKSSPAFRRQLQARIAEILYEMASVQYRLMNSESTRKFHAGYRTEYQKTLNRIVQIETMLIREEPRSESLPRYHFLLAQAYKELEKDSLAITNYQILIDRFPNHGDNLAAHFALHELLNKKKNYQTAIIYLKKLKVTSKEKHYPLVLDLLAFDYFYLNQLTTAIGYLEAEYRYYRTTEKTNEEDLFAKETGSSEREKVIKNISLFYYSLFESGNKNYAIERFQVYLRDKLQTGLDIGYGFKFLGALLRSRGKYAEFQILKDQVLVAKLRYRDLVEFLVSAMDKETLRKEYPYVRKSSEVMLQVVKNHKKKGKEASDIFESIRKSIEQSVGFLQKIYQGEARPEFKAQVRNTLIRLYEDLLVLADDNDAVAGGIHFNLAELYFSEKDWSNAISHYKWIFLDHSSDMPEKAFVLRSHYRAIVSGFEDLTLKKKIPLHVKAVPYKQAKKLELSDGIKDWINWVKKYPRKQETLGGSLAKSGSINKIQKDQKNTGKSSKGEKGSTFDTSDDAYDLYYYTMVHVLYANGHVDQALDAIEEFMELLPQSKYFVPLASLYLDSYFVASYWDKTIDAATRILRSKGVSSGGFSAKVVDIASEAYFKQIEKNYQDKNYSRTISRCEEFLKAYPSAKRKDDALALAGHAALGRNDKKTALQYFKPLIKTGSPAAVLSTAYLTEASVAEEEYRLAHASQEYEKYIQLLGNSSGVSARDSTELRSKIAVMMWVDRRPNVVKSSVWEKLVCGKDLSQSCSNYLRYEGISIKKSGWNPSSDWNALLGSLEALDRSKQLSLEIRLRNIESAVSTWNGIDSLLQYSALHDLLAVLPSQMSAVVSLVQKTARLDLDKTRINKRVKLIEKVEKTFEKVLSLPWISLQVTAFQSWADLYSDLYQDFGSLAIPKGLSKQDQNDFRDTINELKKPFFEKAKGFRLKAYQLAMSSGVQSSHFVPVAQAMAKEDSQLSQKMRPGDQMRVNLAPIFLAAMKMEKINPSWMREFSAAVESKNWPKIAFLIQLMGADQRGFEKGHLALARAASLALAGAQADALALFNQADPSVSGRAKGYFHLAEAIAFFGVRSLEPTKKNLERFFSKTGEKDWSALTDRSIKEVVTQAISWSGADIGDDDREGFLSANRRSL